MIRVIHHNTVTLGTSVGYIIYQPLVLAQVGETPFVILYFVKLFFRIMIVKKTFDAAMTTTKLFLCTACDHLSAVVHSMSAVNSVCLFVINCFSQMCHMLSKAGFHNLCQLLKSCQKVELKLSKFVAVVVCQNCVLALFLLLFWKQNYLIMW